ncbi:hypothetical protein [Actinoplanes sp. G11-F43]|uniref:hypothetical protein n=1 Tax=Actinoplanes sp. G11-F43 TaxID=3424130 RepID=UPI003D324EA1
MSLDKSGELWRGRDFEDLAAAVRDFRAGGYRVDTVIESRCAGCDGRAFRVDVDEQDNTRRVCLACGASRFIGDSAEHWDEDAQDNCECPCGGDRFAVAVGFACHDDGDVRWISVGLRCLADGTLGVYADWKIDYGPSRHLLTRV